MLIGVVWLVVLFANQVSAAQAQRDSKQADYVRGLEKALAACLGDKEGALFIGGELHLCRAVPTGIKEN